MPRRRFVGQVLVDFLLSQDYEICPEPEGPPTGTVILSRDCSDERASIVLVHATVELGADYAEKHLTRIGLDPNEFWTYIEGQ